MLMRYRTNSGRVTVEVNSDSPVDAFDMLADVTEILEQDKCGACQSDAVRFQSFEHDGYRIRALACVDCGCELGLGLRKDGSKLFPKRKDKDGNWLENGGWVKRQRNEQGSGF